MEDKYLSNCTFVKTILMFFVIIGHSISFWNGAWFTALTPEKTSTIFKYLSIFIGGFHIYGFALISGYIFYYLKIEKHKYQNYLSFILTKFKRLIIPFIFVLVCWVIPINQYFFKYKSNEIIFRYLLGTNPSQLWFLLMLFWVFIIFWPLAHFVDQHSFYGFIIMCCFYLVGLFGSNICSNYYMIWTACTYVLFFGCGFLIRKFKIDKICNNSKLFSLFFIGSYFILFSIYMFTYNVGNVSAFYKIYSYGLQCIFHLVGGVSAFFVLQSLANTSFNNEITIKLAKYSMPIYLFHEQIIYVVIALLNGKLNIYVLSIFCFVISVCLSYLISKLLFKWKFTRILIGEKS